MPIAASNGIELCFETFGDRSDPALLLVSGYTSQLLGWDEGLCAELAARGRFVIRFDNRDVGLSTKLDGQHVDIGAVLAASMGAGTMPEVPYRLSAFADDAFGLLDHLGIDAAHIMGMSMGGMIVQTMAIEHPERVLSMVSVMSTTGEPDYFQSVPEVMKALMTPPPADRAGFIAHASNTAKLFSSPRYFDQARAEEKAAAGYDRCFYPEGAVRQLAAIRSSGDRAEALRTLDVPTLVIHGRQDTLILPKGGERTAELVPGANLLLLHDMGHDLPQPLWPLLVDAVVSHTAHRI